MRLLARGLSRIKSLLRDFVRRVAGLWPRSTPRNPPPPPDEHDERLAPPADQHDQWLALVPVVTILEHGSPLVKVGIRSKIGAQVLETHACHLTHPNGVMYHTRVDSPASGETFFFNYPDDFAEAPPPVTGRYEIAWFRGKRRKLREIVRHTEVIDVG